MIGLREVYAGLIVVTLGCYSPTFREGVSCGAEGECPTGQVCRNGECRSPSKIPDANPDNCPNPTALMFTPTNFDVCDIPAEPPALELTTLTPIDTDAGTIAGEPGGIILEQDGGPEIMLVAARSFSLASGIFIDVTGSRPLVLVSLQDMNIDGVILSAGNLSNAGAEIDNGSGVALDQCGAGVGANGVADGSVFTGGGGGGFGAVGGIGAGLPAMVTVAGGEENGAATVVPLRGGCPGGLGGGPRGGAPGGGGGAIQLVAAGTITLGELGQINVAGGAGRGGGSQGAGVITSSGGGGGGSGGAVLIEAGLGITISTGAIITTAGGGGGGGAYDAAAGGDGSNGGTNGAGAGGAGAIVVATTSEGGNGGIGGGLDPVAGSDGASGIGLLAGGGGGGGSSGRILLRSPANGVSGVTFPAAVDSALE